ncbi:unnamed protein product [Blepharisma stoltei]|uniref:TH1 domain-containing protein n=1 Tax=Blepharisma stoltei TaxID=1481888 RepID=A0AAU9KBS5_9CILI|nr:unnamed protein product [Blepharisma stoltei]
MGNYCCTSRIRPKSESISKPHSRSPSRELSKKSTMTSIKSGKTSPRKLQKQKPKKEIDDIWLQSNSSKDTKNTKKRHKTTASSFPLELLETPKQNALKKLPSPITEAPSNDELSDSFYHRKSMSFNDFSKTILDESSEELEYFLEQAKSLPQADRKKILTLLNIYKSEIPEDQEEVFDGFADIVLHESSNYTKEMRLLLTSHAIYIVSSKDISSLNRRINLLNISLISTEKSLTNAIFHLVKSELQGDLWISCSNLIEVIKGVESVYQHLMRRYVPILKNPSLGNLKSKFNSMSQMTIQSNLADEMIKFSNAIIGDGRIGENIVFHRKTRRLTNRRAELDCIALLTDMALYCLNVEYKIESRLELKDIKEVTLSESMDQVIIQRANGDEELWVLPSKFVTELEKAIAGTKQKRLTVVIGNKSEMNDFVKSIQ